VAGVTLFGHLAAAGYSGSAAAAGFAFAADASGGVDVTWKSPAAPSDGWIVG
jgi:hypothetical protein